MQGHRVPVRPCPIVKSQVEGDRGGGKDKDGRQEESPFFLTTSLES